jgi:hypothetical protein
MSEKPKFRLVIIESPYAGNVVRNLRYLQRCIQDCIKRDESPYASHQMLTAALNDLDPDDRKKGIEAGFAWRAAAAATVVYTDHGLSGGMKMGISDASRIGQVIEWREIGAEADE